MKLKETIKSKVDQLDASDLRIVEMLIDSLKGRRKKEGKKLCQIPPFLKVINLIVPGVLTSDDIHKGRQERI
jgi:hypothetical protein